MKTKIMLCIVALWGLSMMGALAQTVTNAGVVLTPQQVQKLNDSIDSIVPLLPARYQGAAASLIGLLAILAFIGRIYVGWKRNGIAGVFAGLFGGTNHSQVVDNALRSAQPPDKDPDSAVQRAQSPKGASMNTVLALVLGAGIWGAGLTAQAQQMTNQVPNLIGSTNAFNFVHWVSTFFTDNTNFFGQHTVIGGVAPLYSHGHDASQSVNDSDNFGGVLSVEFPMDANGQLCIGLWAAYFDSTAAYGSLNVQLGKTLTVPSWVPLLGGQQAYLSDEVGPGYRWDLKGQPFLQNFTLLTWKKTVHWGLPHPLTLMVTGGHGTADPWKGDIWLIGPQLSYAF